MDNSIERLVTDAREHGAPQGLGQRILATSGRRRFRRRAAWPAAIAAALLIGGLFLLPPNAYAGLDQAIVRSSNADIVQMRTWKVIDGKEMTLGSTFWQGVKSRKESPWVILVDDGKSWRYLSLKENHLFVDVSETKNVRKPDFSWAMDKRWSWMTGDRTAKYKGTPAVLYKGKGTFRDAGREQSIETTVYVERDGGRILYYEQWRDNRSYASYCEFTYPKSAQGLFELPAPKGAKTTDLVALRAELVRKARATEHGFVFALRDFGGAVAVVTKGGTMPDDSQPQDILVNGKSVGKTLRLFYRPKASPIPKLAVDAWYQQTTYSANPKAMNSPVKLTFPTWKKLGGKTVPGTPQTIDDVTIPLVPSIWGLLRHFTNPG